MWTNVKKNTEYLFSLSKINRITRPTSIFLYIFSLLQIEISHISFGRFSFAKIITFNK